jgi:hypothetical protein
MDRLEGDAFHEAIHLSISIDCSPAVFVCVLSVRRIASGTLTVRHGGRHSDARTIAQAANQWTNDIWRPPWTPSSL